MPRSFDPLTPPFDPAAPPSGVHIIPDPDPKTIWVPNLVAGIDYLLVANKGTRTKPIQIIDGGNVVLDGFHIKLANSVGEMLSYQGGDPGRIVDFRNGWVDPNGYQCDLAKTKRGFDQSILQWKNIRCELIFGSKTTTHADLLQAAGGYKEIWVEDFAGHSAYEGFQEQQEASLVGPSLHVTKASRVGNSATFTCPSHPFTAGMYVEVNGTGTQYDGGYQIDGVAGSGATKTFTVTLGDVTPPSPATFPAAAAATQMTFPYPCGDFHTNRVSIVGHASPLGPTNNPPKMIAAGRIGARTAPTSGPSTGSHPGEDQTPITDTAWAGSAEFIDFYLSGQYSNEFKPDDAASVYHVVRAHIDTSVTPHEWSWPDWGKVTGKISLAANPLGDAVQIIGGVPTAMWPTSAPPTAPSFTSGPSVAGTAQVGQTLTASETVTGSPTPSIARKWQKALLLAGPWQAFGGTGPTQLLSPAEQGYHIRVQEVLTNTAGTVTAHSTGTAVVTAAPVPPHFDALPTVSGSGVVGSTLTTDNGSVSGDPPITYTYRWVKRLHGTSAWTLMPGETANTLSLDAAKGLVGYDVDCEVYATNATATTMGMDPTPVLVHDPPATLATNTRIPAIALTGGTLHPLVGQQVKGDDGTWAGTQPMTPARQWYRSPNADGSAAVAIGGATGQTYVVAVADVAYTLVYGVAETNAAGTSAEARSLPTPFADTDTAPSPTPVPGVRLGCGQYDVYILQRGGSVIRHNLDQWTSLQFTQPDGDTGTAQVGISGLGADAFADCCKVLRDVLPWADEVALYRRANGDLQGSMAWVGPVGDPDLQAAKASIPAADLSAWFSVRFVHHDLTWDGADIATVAQAIAADAVEPDNTMGIIIDRGSALLSWSESILAASYTLAGDRLRALAQAGLHWHMQKRHFVTDDSLPPLAFVDEHFAAPPEVKLLGSVQATRTVTVGQSSGTPVAPAASQSADDLLHLYGLVERVHQTDVASDAAAQADADAWRALVENPVYVVEQGVLSEDAPVHFSDLRPGRRVSLRLTETCYPITGPYRLAAIDVTAGAGKEQVTVHFTPEAP